MNAQARDWLKREIDRRKRELLIGERAIEPLDDAALFLQRALASGPRPAADVVAAAERAGISVSRLKRAKTRLGIRFG